MSADSYIQVSAPLSLVMRRQGTWFLPPCSSSSIRYCLLFSASRSSMRRLSRYSALRVIMQNGQARYSYKAIFAVSRSMLCCTMGSRITGDGLNIFSAIRIRGLVIARTILNTDISENLVPGFCRSSNKYNILPMTSSRHCPGQGK